MGVVMLPAHDRQAGTFSPSRRHKIWMGVSGDGCWSKNSRAARSWRSSRSKPPVACGVVQVPGMLD